MGEITDRSFTDFNHVDRQRGQRVAPEFLVQQETLRTPDLREVVASRREGPLFKDNGQVDARAGKKVRTPFAVEYGGTLIGKVLGSLWNGLWRGVRDFWTGLINLGTVLTGVGIVGGGLFALAHYFPHAMALVGKIIFGAIVGAYGLVIVGGLALVVFFAGRAILDGLKDHYHETVANRESRRGE